jgi:hypothetical protein
VASYFKTCGRMRRDIKNSSCFPRDSFRFDYSYERTNHNKRKRSDLERFMLINSISKSLKFILQSDVNMFLKRYFLQDDIIDQLFGNRLRPILFFGFLTGYHFGLEIECSTSKLKRVAWVNGTMNGNIIQGERG